MYFHVFDLKNNDFTNKCYNAFCKGITTANFKIHNFTKNKFDSDLYRFNIVLQKEEDNILSKETWYKIGVGYLSKKHSLLLINEFNNKDVIHNFHQELSTLLDIKINPKQCDKETLVSILNKNYHVNSVSFINNKDELSYSSIAFEELINEDIKIIEISFFDKNDSLIRVMYEGKLYISNEEHIHQNLDFYEETI